MNHFKPTLRKRHLPFLLHSTCVIHSILDIYVMNSTESEKFDILFVKHKNLLNEYAAFSPPILFYCYPVVGQTENFLLRPRNGNSDYYGAQTYDCFNTYFAEQGIS